MFHCKTLFVLSLLIVTNNYIDHNSYKYKRITNIPIINSVLEELSVTGSTGSILQSPLHSYE